jgi:hypothetical protein
MAVIIVRPGLFPFLRLEIVRELVDDAFHEIDRGGETYVWHSMILDHAPVRDAERSAEILPVHRHFVGRFDYDVVPVVVVLAH